MTAPTTNAYDEVPYLSYPFPDSHPDRLSTVARLFGLRPPDPANCRVLEMGSASGGNLLPMAEVYPNNTFVGVELAARQVETGRARIAELGLKNVELRHASITDIDEKYGKFDFIICHGVYSWVPDAVQDHILRVCKQNLSPNGVAYVSYNTLPGWHMRGMIRDMMRYHAGRFAEPAQRIGQARALLDFLVKAVGDQPNMPYPALLKHEVELLKQAQDWYLYHEHLEDNNSPIYFHQFVQRAAGHGLRFLGESQIRQMVPGNYPPETEQVLQRLSNDIIHMEQYMDFIRNRMFRQSLLCHPEQTPDYNISPDRLRGLYLGTMLKPSSAKPDLATTAAEKFQVPNSAGSVTVSDPLAKQAVMVLVEAWPRSLLFEDVVRQARRRLTPAQANDPSVIARDEQTLGRMFLQFLTSVVDRLVDVRSTTLPLARTPGEKPLTTAVARQLARNGTHSANPRHELANLGDFERNILQRLDGQHDRDKLLDELMALVRNGTLTVRVENQLVTEPEKQRAAIGNALDQAIPRFAELGYLLEPK